MSFLFAWLVNELPAKIRAVATLLFFAHSLVGGAVTLVEAIRDALNLISVSDITGWFLSSGYFV